MLSVYLSRISRKSSMATLRLPAMDAASTAMWYVTCRPGQGHTMVPRGVEVTNPASRTDIGEGTQERGRGTGGVFVLLSIRLLRTFTHACMHECARRLPFSWLFFSKQEWLFLVLRFLKYVHWSCPPPSPTHLRTLMVKPGHDLV